VLLFLEIYQYSHEYYLKVLFHEYIFFYSMYTVMYFCLTWINNKYMTVYME